MPDCGTGVSLYQQTAWKLEKSFPNAQGGVISGSMPNFSMRSMRIYKQCNNQVQHYFNELIKIQNIFIAMELIVECNDESKNQNINKIIDKLINPSAHISDNQID